MMSGFVITTYSAGPDWMIPWFAAFAYPRFSLFLITVRRLSLI